MVTLGAALYALGGGTPVKQALSSEAAGVAAVRAINDDLNQVFAPGVDLVVGDPQKAYQLLTAAWEQVATAKAANVPDATLDPLRARRLPGSTGCTTSSGRGGTDPLDRRAKGPLDIGAMILGPQGVPFILDRSTASVYRVDLRTKKATVVYRSKTHAAGAIEGVPRLITTAARDLVIIDTKNVVWRWRPADQSGQGTTTRIPVQARPAGATTSWRSGRSSSSRAPALYNLYVVDPSAQNILAYSPDRDGSGFHSAAQQRLTVARDVLEDDRPADRRRHLAGRRWDDRALVGGASEGLDDPATRGGDLCAAGRPPAPGRALLHLIASASDKRAGLLYAWDKVNGRVVAFRQGQGTFRRAVPPRRRQPGLRRRPGHVCGPPGRLGRIDDAHLGDERLGAVGGARGGFRTSLRPGRLRRREPPASPGPKTVHASLAAGTAKASRAP